jgi:hypothetical protein
MPPTVNWPSTVHLKPACVFVWFQVTIRRTPLMGAKGGPDWTGRIVA